MGHPVASIVGMLIGGFIGIYILSMLVEFVICKRVFDDPVRGKTISVISAYLIGSILYGFNNENRAIGFIVYFIPSIIVGVIFYRRGIKIRTPVETSDFA